MVITTLIDNSASKQSALSFEHGFSCLIETPDVSVLFDTGASEAFLGNARLLGKDLGEVDHVVISHGHYDHGGGLRPLLETNGLFHATLWTGKGFTDKKYVVEDGKQRYLGGRL